MGEGEVWLWVGGALGRARPPFLSPREPALPVGLLVTPRLWAAEVHVTFLQRLALRILCALLLSVADV